MLAYSVVDEWGAVSNDWTGTKLPGSHALSIPHFTNIGGQFTTRIWDPPFNTQDELLHELLIRMDYLPPIRALNANYFGSADMRYESAGDDDKVYSMRFDHLKYMRELSFVATARIASEMREAGKLAVIRALNGQKDVIDVAHSFGVALTKQGGALRQVIEPSLTSMTVDAMMHPYRFWRAMGRAVIKSAIGSRGRPNF